MYRSLPVALCILAFAVTPARADMGFYPAFTTSQRGCAPFPVDVGTISGQSDNQRACEQLADKMFDLKAPDLEKICEEHGGIPPQSGQPGSQCTPKQQEVIEQIFCYKSEVPGQDCGIPLPGPSIVDPTYPFGGAKSGRH
jgi:hypothetical protein